ncbi:MAG: hypothetical protein JXB07_19055 [Anaerolineae bacterium]|nr:hypothetical protein [Anaerolineae bacterium]
MKCEHCGCSLRDDGTQFDALAKKAWTLGTCTNQACRAFLSTFFMAPRPMTEEEMGRYKTFLEGKKDRG